MIKLKNRKAAMNMNINPMGTSGRMDIKQKPAEAPDWIWDGSRIKRDALIRLHNHLAETQVKYLNALILLGGAGADYEVSQKAGMPVHLISARRNELKHKGIIIKGEKILGPHGAANTVWHINYNRLKQYAEI
ncbi:MAG TPA: hypothetical protein VHP30_16115 [Ignavibacteriales bacterium]|nr:hypothetical protein [Ignavibacteriales bacterium]